MSTNKYEGAPLRDAILSQSINNPPRHPTHQNPDHRQYGFRTLYPWAYRFRALRVCVAHADCSCPTRCAGAGEGHGRVRPAHCACAGRQASRRHGAPARSPMPNTPRVRCCGKVGWGYGACAGCAHAYGRADWRAITAFYAIARSQHALSPAVHVSLASRVFRDLPKQRDRDERDAQRHWTGHGRSRDRRE